MGSFGRWREYIARFAQRLFKPSGLLAFVGVVVWLALVAFGMGSLAEYGAKPGSPGSAVLQWPAEANLKLASKGSTLVMAVHPKCVCTRASMEELSTVLRQARGHVAAYLLFFHPRGEAAKWAHSDLWKTATALKGVSAVQDEDGRIAARFGTATSGHVLLYASTGKLLFNGGITDGRGHAGINAGRLAVLSLLNAGLPDRRVTPVFGCSLADPDTQL